MVASRKSAEIRQARLRAATGVWPDRTNRQEIAPPSRALDASFPWDSEFLHYFVREPFPSRTTGASLVSGRIEAGSAATIVSGMAEHGVIFSDGIEADFLEFNAGARATIGIAERQGLLVV